MPVTKHKRLDGANEVHSLEEAARRQSPGREVVHLAILLEGEEELARSNLTLAWSGLAAGLSMGFSLIAEALLTYHLPEGPWRSLGAKLGYSVGFVVVILGRQQFFTENTLTVILPLLMQKKLSLLLNVLRLWGIVLAANLAGVFAVTWILANTATLNPGLHTVLISLGTADAQAGFSTTLLRAIFAGWLIALMVWLLPFAESGRITVIVLLTYIIGLAEFPHVIAGSAKLFYLVAINQQPLLPMLGLHVLPALIGNCIGGVTIVAALGHAQVADIKHVAKA
jgi:formate-nitrite transporter family protein